MPLDWTRFNAILDAWLTVLEGEESVATYLEHYAPNGSEYLESDDIEKMQGVKCNGPYCNFFRERNCTEWLTTEFWGSQARKQQESQLLKIYGLDEVLSVSIKQSALVDLPGADPFKAEPFSFNHFYGRLHDSPHVQVAGTKNYHWFLRAIFNSAKTGFSRKIRYIYRYERKAEWPSTMQELLEKLFYGVRCLPGVGILRDPPSVRADDTPQFMGFLDPAEVVHLASFETTLTSAAEAFEDDLFPLFADRLRRSAVCGAGLISIQSGL